METNRGAPTPPIVFPNGAGRATARLTDGFVEVDDKLEARLAATGANVTRAPPRSSTKRAATGGRSR